MDRPVQVPFLVSNRNCAQCPAGSKQSVHDRPNMQIVDVWLLLRAQGLPLRHMRAGVAECCFYSGPRAFSSRSSEPRKMIPYEIPMRAGVALALAPNGPVAARDWLSDGDLPSPIRCLRRTASGVGAEGANSGAHKDA